MKKKTICATLLSLCLLAGCTYAAAPTPDPLPDPEYTQAESRDPSGASAEAPKPARPLGEEQDMAENIRRAARVVDAAAKEGENFLYSPVSLEMALGLVSEGAKGETREQLLNYLGTSDYSAVASEYLKHAEEITLIAQEAETDVTSGDDHGGLREEFWDPFASSRILDIANSLWVSDKYSLTPEFAETAGLSYDAESAALDFNDKARTVRTVNNWCSEKTRGMIPQIIGESSITPDLSVILCNSVYFESPWFEKWSVREGEFTNYDQTSVKMDDMLYDTLGTYYENDRATAFAKSYMNGLTFIGILPKKEGDFTLADLALDELLANRYTEYDVDASMPKLNYDTSVDSLISILSGEGVTDVFSDSVSDLSGLLDTADVTYISAILQKCKIELDENGTKAAAVTAIMMETCALAPEPPEVKEVHLNRPFAYMIYDEAYHQVLFIGKVTNL